jgi:hypothetical protein
VPECVPACLTDSLTHSGRARPERGQDPPDLIAALDSRVFVPPAHLLTGCLPLPAAVFFHQAELDKSEGKIRELIAALDMRKDEAIERTFKGVAKHFRDVFAELVPGGKGELVMQKRLGGAAGAGGACVPNFALKCALCWRALMMCSDDALRACACVAGGADDEEGGGGAGGGAGGSGSGAAEKYSGVKVGFSFSVSVFRFQFGSWLSFRGSPVTTKGGQRGQGLLLLLLLPAVACCCCCCLLLPAVAAVAAVAAAVAAVAAERGRAAARRALLRCDPV